MDLLPVTVNDIGILNGLVGIIIVTNSSRGHHFVYKYPPDHNDNNYQGSSTRSTQDSKSSHPDVTRDEFQIASKIFGYDPQFLANVLSPKLALCDKRFQLTVDGLTFIGHPVALTGPEFKQRRAYWKWKARRPQKQQVRRGWVDGSIASFMDDSDSGSDYYEEDSNDEGSKEGKEGPIRRGSKEDPEAVIIPPRPSTDPTSWRQSRLRSQTYNSNPASPASGDSPLAGSTPQQTPSLTGQANFTSSSLLHYPVSMPQTPTTGAPPPPPPIQVSQGSNTSSNTGSSQSTQVQYMSFFHVVFVLQPPELQLNSVADQVYKNIACKLTAALRYEELNSQYVSQEATKILTIREEASQAGMTLNEYHEHVLAASSLARAVRSIYDCISADKVCHVVLNDSIDISLQIPHLAPLQRTCGYVTRSVQNTLPSNSPTGPYSNGNTYSNGQYNGNHNNNSNGNNNNNGNNGHGNNGNHGYNNNNSASQQALMTPMVGQYGGVGAMMDDYEFGIAYEYENFPVLLPYHTLLLLEDPEEILKDIPLDANPTLVKLVQILVPYQWAVIADFLHHFPTLSLPSILHELSTPKAFKAHIPGAGKDKEVQTVYLEMLTYLLRKDLIVQLHTYIMVLVPEYIKRGLSAEDYESILGEENSGTLTPTLESPTIATLGQVGSAKSADFAHSAMKQQQQQQSMSQKQQAMPSQTYRYHNRSSTGGAQGGPNSAGAGGGMSSSFKSHTSMQLAKLFGKRQDESSILPNPGQASEVEREWMGHMCRDQPRSVAELFMRLIHYFDGQHHVEEILFREQIVAKDLKTVLSAFRDFLILTWA
ncbi:Nitrogen permease regulator 3 [Entomortierella chlamydospora]|nr:Nitrogen permease regulator 3 [Entomortierella chlamydospora]